MKQDSGQDSGKKPVGRPSGYSEEVAQDICSRLMAGESLRQICRDEHMPTFQTVFNWLHANKSFFEHYARARDVQAEILVEECFEIADDGSNDYMTITKGDVSYNVEDREVTNRSRLRVDTRKWYVSKVLPKKYGDKLAIEHDVSAELADRIAKARKNVAAG